MNHIDATSHYEVEAAGQTPSLLTLVIDTNPRAWAALHPTLPFSAAIANLLIFVNAHLAFGNDNQVAILAAHCDGAVWLYSTPPGGQVAAKANNGDGDIEMDGAEIDKVEQNANKYPPFSHVESSVLSSLRSLISTTSPSDLPSTTQISGALTLALSYIHKKSLSYAPPKSSSDAANPTTAPTGPQNPTMHARILVINVSDSEPAQYIPTMNAVFAASHSQIPIDTLSLSPHASPIFLEQAAFITNGSYLSASPNPRDLLTYLMFGLLPDAEARADLLIPTQDSIDFRAACFCHRKVIKEGFVCSICLSIFCEPPNPDGEGAECLTCGTRLKLGSYGARPAVIPKKKKKKRHRLNGLTGREETASATGTPGP